MLHQNHVYTADPPLKVTHFTLPVQSTDIFHNVNIFSTTKVCKRSVEIHYTTAKRHSHYTVLATFSLKSRGTASAHSISYWRTGTAHHTSNYIRNNAQCVFCFASIPLLHILQTFSVVFVKVCQSCFGHESANLVSRQPGNDFNHYVTRIINAASLNFGEIITKLPSDLSAISKEDKNLFCPGREHVESHFVILYGSIVIKKICGMHWQ